jgi:hypothetical protein
MGMGGRARDEWGESNFGKFERGCLSVISTS